MTTNFQKLPIIDLSPVLKWPNESGPVTADIQKLSKEIRTVFETVGFAYLINHGVGFNHDQITSMTKQFFELDDSVKLSLAKRTFRPSNSNTYRGYFPVQDGDASYKEGFEVGPLEQSSEGLGKNSEIDKFILRERNVWPEPEVAPKFQKSMQAYYQECLRLADKFMSLISISFGLDPSYFRPYFDQTVSTLRLLHYPKRDSNSNSSDKLQLSCASHTDSGIVTILFQDPTGGLEVQNSTGDWIPAPYVPESFVVNLGDLMNRWTRGRFVATHHRVRRVLADRISVPFFFEPNVDALIEPIKECATNGELANDEFEPVIYGQFVREKMSTWVEYQDIEFEDVCLQKN